MKGLGDRSEAKPPVVKRCSARICGGAQKGHEWCAFLLPLLLLLLLLVSSASCPSSCVGTRTEPRDPGPIEATEGQEYAEALAFTDGTSLATAMGFGTPSRALSTVLPSYPSTPAI
eukprot:407258-Pyramimonas_sp.AAC.1